MMNDLVLTSADIDAFIYGTSVLASGGGGDPYIGGLFLKAAFASGPMSLLDPANVDDHALVVAVGAIGAPTVFLERLPNLEALAAAVRGMEETVGRDVGALVAAEAGGLNASLPIALGRKLDLPVVDADGMGRAFPEGQMMTYGIYGGRASPIIVVNDDLEVAVIRERDNRRAEIESRAAVERMGNAGMAAIYPMNGAFFKRATVCRTLTLARDMGAAALAARAAKRDPVDALIEYFAHGSEQCRRAARLFEGKVVDVLRTTGGGFIRGKVTIEARSGQRCEIIFQNENLAVRIGGRIAALVPDIITLLEQDTGEPVTAENVRYAQRVTVFGLAAPAMMSTPEALLVVGPRAFGLDEDYRPFCAAA